jgi:crossover junction endodeoxyribonuclease RuvC
MKVLGIDPGTGRMGWAIVEGNRARQTLVACGCEDTPKTMTQADRLVNLWEKIAVLIEEHHPDCGAVEDLFFFKNAKTVIRVAESRGVVVAGITREHLTVYDYSPLQIKKAITGYGKAEKVQVQMMVKTILKLPAVPKPDDAADAVAVALTHLFVFNEKL